jgi:hypothetical protein
MISSFSVSCEFHDQGDNVDNYYCLSKVTETANYALRMANPQTADKLAGGWPLAWRIIMTP